MSSVYQTQSRQAGYTLDQTILIVAVIAILVTIIIASMGWELLSRAGGTKLASHLRQVETANGQFYAQHNLWPHQVATGGGSTAAANMGVLLADAASFDTNVVDPADANNPAVNFLPAYSMDGGVVKHSFGSGGDITQEQANFGGQNYLTVTYTNVPLTEAIEANESIDGETAAEKDATTRWTSGRIQGLNVTGSTVDLVYYANVIN